MLIAFLFWVRIGVFENQARPLKFVQVMPA
jgi:hypothetical protein